MFLETARRVLTRRNIKPLIMRLENHFESKRICFYSNLGKVVQLPEFQGKLFFKQIWVGGSYRDSLFTKVPSVMRVRLPFTISWVVMIVPNMPVMTYNVQWLRLAERTGQNLLGSGRGEGKVVRAGRGWFTSFWATVLHTAAAPTLQTAVLPRQHDNSLFLCS